MPTVGTSSKPAYVYDAGTDTWIPVGPGAHTHDYSANAHNHDSTYIPKSLTTTTGDIVYASAANTPARLGIGTTGQNLVVASGIPSWATPSSGGMTSIANGAMASTVSMIGIVGTYTDLYLVLDNVVTSVNDTGGVRINNDTTAANYVGVSTRQITGTGPTTQAQTNSFVDGCCGSSFMTSQTANSFVYRFSNYASTTGWKNVVSQGGHNNNLSTFSSGQNVVSYRSTSAITRLDLVTAGSSWAAQGTYTLYGVK